MRSGERSAPTALLALVPCHTRTCARSHCCGRVFSAMDVQLDVEECPLDELVLVLHLVRRRRHCAVLESSRLRKYFEKHLLCRQSDSSSASSVVGESIRVCTPSFLWDLAHCKTSAWAHATLQGLGALAGSQPPTRGDVPVILFTVSSSLFR